MMMFEACANLAWNQQLWVSKYRKVVKYCVFKIQISVCTSDCLTIYNDCAISFLPLTVPSYPLATWNQSYDLERDRVTGLVDVIYHLTLINHWKSLAILSSITGHLFAQTYEPSHIALERYSKRMLVRVSVVKYYCLFVQNLLGWV